MEISKRPMGVNDDALTFAEEPRHDNASVYRGRFRGTAVYWQ
jgi:hypothetical protein